MTRSGGRQLHNDDLQPLTLSKPRKPVMVARWRLVGWILIGAIALGGGGVGLAGVRWTAGQRVQAQDAAEHAAYLQGARDEQEALARWRAVNGTSGVGDGPFPDPSLYADNPYLEGSYAELLAEAHGGSVLRDPSGSATAGGTCPVSASSGGVSDERSDEWYREPDFRYRPSGDQPLC